MKEEPSAPELEIHAPESAAAGKTAVTVPTTVLVLGFAVVLLLGVLIAMAFKSKPAASAEAPEAAEGSEDPAMRALKAQLQVMKENLNRDRVKLNLSPAYDTSTAESAEAVAKRITGDAATLVALSKNVNDLISAKDAERAKTSKDLTEALKRQNALVEEIGKLKRERDEAVIESATADTSRLQLESASRTIKTLQEEITRLGKVPADFQARLAAVTGERDVLLARIAELESRVSKTSLFAGTESEIFSEAVELFRSLRGLEGLPDSEISQAYSQYGAKLGASVFGKLEFPTGSAELAPADFERVRAFPTDAPDNALIIVIGYASETGNVDDNRTLSSDRATAVARALDAVKKPGQRVQAAYLGQTDRFGSSSPERNQICEVWQIVPKP